MKWQRGIWGLVFLLTLFFVLALATRNGILQWVFKREQAHLKAAYGLTLHADAKFVAWNGVQLSNLSLQPDGADTLVCIKTLACKPAISGLLRGQLSFKELKLDSVVVTIFHQPRRDNLAFLKGYHATKNSGSATGGFYSRAEDLKDKLLRLLNTAFEIKNLQLSYRDTAFAEQVYAPYFNYDLHTAAGIFINRQQNDTLTLSAEVIKKSQRYNVSLTHTGDVLCYLPFMDAERGFKCRFKSVSVLLSLNESGSELQISPTVHATNFHINHWRLAKEDVVFPQAQFAGLIKIRQDGFELDSSATVILNHDSFHVFTAYQVRPDTMFAFNINMPETVADTFFNALPGGMFNTLKGISCSGTLAYNLHFKIYSQQPDSLEFTSELKRKNLHIIHYGKENYGRINEPFIYDAYSGDQFIRHILVGAGNNDFTPIGRINPRLPAAIMQSEDPSFMVHRGFVPEAFKESIAKNYKEHRFARGGSTISMQLVKNVFLNHNKTISRKAEEALIVYLIENLGLVPKERMMEVYLNVIEWGPNIYGATEASRFYFNKPPARLSLQECIFLAAIIPNPRFFRYQFDKQGEMKGYMSDFFKIILNRLVTRGYISEQETAGFEPTVRLTGPALRMIMPADSMPVPNDELPLDE